MYKFIRILFVAILLNSCSTEAEENFDYEVALLYIRDEISSNPGIPTIKADLLSKIDMILKEDTSYHLGSNLRDSLREKYIYEQEFKRLSNQLNLELLDEFTFEDDIEVYKFKYRRAFSDNIVAISIANQKPYFSIKTQVYQLNDKCEYEIGIGASIAGCYTILLNEQRRITEIDWNRFKELIKKASFWNLDSRDGRSGLDGSSWVVEGSKRSGNNKQVYKMVYRWSPREEDKLKSIGLFLLEFSGKDFGEIY
jgi:hypothetical protein